jgi:vacuolar-type H+-ATPase subunit I/STV1
MVHFWVREILGWLLVILGIYVFMVALAILLNPPPPAREPRILEAPAVVLIGFIIFRGGIHLLKVAVAARVAMQAQAMVRKETTDKTPTRSATPWDW